MELYEKRNLKENDCQSQGPQLPEYNKELSREEKDKILKDVYASFNLFYGLVCEAKKKSFEKE